MPNKYVLKLRRGTKYVDERGALLLNEDGTPVRDDWAEYSDREDCVNPLDGELVLEYEVVNGTGKRIPRLKIGDGVNKFKDLEYISVDSFLLPTPASVTLYADRWVQDADARYYQRVEVANATITPNSKVDLQPSAEMLTIFYQKDLSFVAENEDGNVSVFCVGQVPENDYQIQVTVTEVTPNG